MFEVDQTERLRPAQLPPVGCWGSDMKTGEEQRLVGTVKDARTVAGRQNSFSETGMKYPPTARASQRCQSSTSVSLKRRSQNREILAHDLYLPPAQTNKYSLCFSRLINEYFKHLVLVRILTHLCILV